MNSACVRPAAIVRLARRMLEAPRNEFQIEIEQQRTVIQQVPSLARRLLPENFFAAARKVSSSATLVTPPLVSIARSLVPQRAATGAIARNAPISRFSTKQ